jgi:hypothetical protein
VLTHPRSSAYSRVNFSFLQLCGLRGIIHSTEVKCGGLGESVLLSFYFVMVVKRLTWFDF